MNNFRQLVPTLTAGLVIGLVEALIAVSFGSLIFSGELTPFLGQGIGLTLVSMMVSLSIVGLLSSQHPIIAAVQDISSVVLALVAASIAAKAAIPGADSTYYTVLAALGITGVATGALMLISSRFPLSGIVRALPYPVIGGLLAGTGWLLMVGGFDLAANGAAFKDYVQGDVLLQWVPALIFALILLISLRRYQHFLLMPGLLVGAFVVFYGAVLISGNSLSEAREAGLLLGPFPKGGLIQPLTPAHWDSIEWDLITGEIGPILTIVVFSLILMILNISGIELARQTDIDLNTELRASGVVNLVNGLMGGLIGFHTISLTVLGHRMGGRSRFLPILAAGVVGAVLLAGTTMLEYFPTPLLGGLLIFLGLGFLVEWCYDSYKQLPRLEHFMILLIVLTVAVVGYIEGVAVGLAAALLLFAVDASRLGMIKHAFTAAEYHSKVVRPPAEMAILERLGTQAQIFALQGFIFFGTANQLVERIRLRQADESLPPLRYLILDLQRVEKMDSSAIYSFIKLQQLAVASEVDLRVTAVPPALQAQLSKRGFNAQSFSDMDLAVEEAENKILREAFPAESTGAYEQQRSIRTQLKNVLPRNIDFPLFVTYLERQVVKEGDVIAKQGDPADALFFVESGLLSVQLEIPNEQSKRLRTVTSGTVVGELAVYLGGPRTASIVVSKAGTVHRLTRAALDRMQVENPELASAFHEYIAKLLSSRLVDTTAALETALS